MGLVSHAGWQPTLMRAFWGIVLPRRSFYRPGGLCLIAASAPAPSDPQRIRAHKERRSAQHRLQSESWYFVPRMPGMYLCECVVVSCVSGISGGRHRQIGDGRLPAKGHLGERASH